MPGQPRAPEVSNTAAGKITIKWLAPSSGGTPTGYRVYRSTSANVASATLLATTSSLSYLDTTPAIGRTYFYWVSAYNGAGESALLSAGSAKG